MARFREISIISAFFVFIAFVGTSYADHFLIVGENASACDTIEAALTAQGHTFLRVDAPTATALTPTEILSTYNATFYMGIPSSGIEQDWCILLMDAGINLLVADNDFGFFYNSSSIYNDYFEATYVSDNGSDGSLTGQGIMTGINPDISSDPFPDDFTIAGTNGTVIFDAPSGNAAGTAIERTPVSGNTYRAIYLAWDYQYTSNAEINLLTAAIVAYLSNQINTQSIPTMNELGMIIMSIILTGSAFWMMRRRQIS